MTKGGQDCAGALESVAAKATGSVEGQCGGASSRTLFSSVHGREIKHSGGYGTCFQASVSSARGIERHCDAASGEVESGGCGRTGFWEPIQLSASGGAEERSLW